MTAVVDLDLSDRGFVQDPYAALASRRRAQPVTWSDQQRCWLVLSYEHASLVLRDPRFSVEHPSGDRGAFGPEPATALHRFLDSLLYRDPPHHARLRAALGRGFTPRAVNGQAAQVSALAERLLDDLTDAADAGDEVDLVAAFAEPLPLLVVCDLLGVPADDRDQFAAWSRQLAPAVGFVQRDKMPELLAAADAYCAYLTEALDARTAVPTDDLLGQLAAHVSEGRIEHFEAVAAAMLMLFAGHETTTNLIANTLWLVLAERARWEALVADPGDIPGALEETLRFASPLQVATGGGRFARVDLELGGAAIAAGDRVVPVLGAANRDPAAFDRPDDYDMRRTPNPHLGFGFGAHFCIGGPLARLEGRIALAALARRFPGMAATGRDDGYRNSFVVRGRRTVPVRLGRPQVTPGLRPASAGHP